MKSPAERLNGLRWRLEATRRLWSAGVEPEMPFLAPRPAEQMLMQGRIDGPDPTETELGPDGRETSFAAVESESLTVRGWATFRSGPCVRVEVWFDEEQLGRARLGVPRADVAGVFEEPYAEVSGFELTVATAALVDGERRRGTIRATATGPRGETNELAPLAISLAHLSTAAAEEPATPLSPAPLAGDLGLRTLVVTHQLTLGGAQLYLMDLLSQLLADRAVDPVVISNTDGPLRAELEALGVAVHVTDLLAKGSVSAHRGRVEELAAWARPFGFEVALVNTATSAVFAGGEAAAVLGIPAVWAIHESFEPALLWADLDAGVRTCAEAAVGEAAFAVFEATATERIYEPLVAPERRRMLPYGLDLEPIDSARATFDRSAARARAGIPADCRLVVCVGTIEPRKAQIPLAEAFDLIGDRHPDSRLAFVGGRADDPNTAALEGTIATSPRRDQMDLIPITPDVADWYAMADLLVCASDVESLPRTVLEAMAWGTPVLATSVFGIPELIDDGETGWLCDTRDTAALADGLDRALSASEETHRSVAANGRRLVETRHSLPRYGAAIAGLLREAVGR